MSTPTNYKRMFQSSGFGYVNGRGLPQPGVEKTKPITNKSTLVKGFSDDMQIPKRKVIDKPVMGIEEASLMKLGQARMDRREVIEEARRGRSDSEETRSKEPRKIERKKVPQVKSHPGGVLGRKSPTKVKKAPRKDKCTKEKCDISEEKKGAKRGRKPTKPLKVKSASRADAARKAAKQRRRINGRFVSEAAWQDYMRKKKL